jgi:hypothetical protein
MPDDVYQEAVLVEGANFTPQVGATYVAKAGDIVLYTPTAASVVTLPPVAQGGPVRIINLAAFIVTVKSADGSTVGGVVGTTGYVVPVGGVGAAVTKATFSSDGTNWWAI